MTIFHLSFSIRIDFVRCRTIAFCSFVSPSNSNKKCRSLRLIYSRHSSQCLSMVFRIDLMFRRTLHRCLSADDVCSACLRLPPHNIKLIWIYFCLRAHSRVPFRTRLFSAFCIQFPFFSFFFSFALFRIWNVIVTDLTAAEYQLTMTWCFSKRKQCQWNEFRILQTNFSDEYLHIALISDSPIKKCTSYTEQKTDACICAASDNLVSFVLIEIRIELRAARIKKPKTEIESLMRPK